MRTRNKLTAAILAALLSLAVVACEGEPGAGDDPLGDDPGMEDDAMGDDAGDDL